MISSDSDLSSIIVLGFQVNPLGFIFLIFFMLILLFQLIGMMIHRWGTFLQLISITEIPNPFRRRKVEQNIGDRELSPKEALAVARELTRFEPDPDYSDSEYDELPEDQDTQFGSETDRPSLRRRKSKWAQEDPRKLYGTIRQKMSERPGYKYSPLPESVLEEEHKHKTREYYDKIDLNHHRHVEEERRRRYLRGGGRATISRNFTVHNQRRRYYREQERRKEAAERRSEFPQGRRQPIPFERRHSRYNQPHRSEGWIRSQHTHHHRPGEELDRQFHRRLNQYLSGYPGY